MGMWWTLPQSSLTSPQKLSLIHIYFTDEERSDPALEKPIHKAEKAAERADKAQANIPKKKVRQTVIEDVYKRQGLCIVFMVYFSEVTGGNKTDKCVGIFL